MAYLPTPDSRAIEVEVTTEHRASAAEFLSQLCREVSSPKRADKQLHVNVGHYEQPGFLNPQLFGFWMLPLLPEADNVMEIPGLDVLGMDWAAAQLAQWARPADLDRLLGEPGALLQDPGDSTAEHPSIWAVTMHPPIETQIESTLTALAMLIARRGLSEKLVGNPVDRLPDMAARVDAETTKLVGEEIRNRGWMSAAKAVSARAHAAGFSLHVSYAGPVFTLAESRARMPLHRHVYNSFPGARDAIDRIVNVLTQSWTLVGPQPEQVLQTTRDMLDTSGIPALTAHAVRDGLVCGVGALALSSVPAKNPWLLRPEEIEALDGESATVSTPTGTERIRPVLAMIGARQLESSLGLSLLEPLVVTASQYDLHLRLLLIARAMIEMKVSQPVLRDWAQTSGALAEAQLATLQNTVSNTFNAAALRLQEPTSAIYLPNRERMSPDVGALSLGPRS